MGPFQVRSQPLFNPSDNHPTTAFLPRGPVDNREVTLSTYSSHVQAPPAETTNPVRIT